MRFLPAVLIGVSLGVTGPAVAAQPVQSSPVLAYKLKPVRTGDEVSAIEVQATLNRTAANSPITLSAPVVYAGVRGIADRIRDLKVSDQQGELTLLAKDDPAVPGGFPYYRHWTTSRTPVGETTISYRALVQPTEQTRGPPFSIRPSGGGVSGGGMSFLVMPEALGPADLAVSWDLSALPAGSIAVASFGEGESHLKGDPERLRQAWYLAGPAGRYPARGSVAGFSAAWLGRAPFDAPAEMAWTARLYQFLGKQFRYLAPPPPYRVFMRFLETPPVGGGTALPGSFMLSAPAGDPKPGAQAPRGTFAHEMTHQWVGFVDAPQGVSSWWAEGLTVYFSALFPKRGGFDDLAGYERAINDISRGYWGFPARDWSAAKITEAGFGDEDIRHIPYSRGALYFANLDAHIRAKSGGKRRLEDALQPIFRSREAGVRFDHEAWKAFLRREIGPEAVAEWERVVIEGGLFTPDAHAFGPCFVRTPTTYPYKDRQLDGFKWVRVPGVKASTCLAW